MYKPLLQCLPALACISIGVKVKITHEDALCMVVALRGSEYLQSGDSFLSIGCQNSGRGILM